MSTPIVPDATPKRGSPIDVSEEAIKLYRALPYEEFLRTDYWASVRDGLIAKVGKCQLCSTLSGLRCHHNSYEHHGSEHLHPEDLTVLCERRHMLFHRTERLGACVPPLYEGASFDNFAIPGPDNPVARRELTGVLLAVKSWVREFPNQKQPGLLLLGFSGTGKTHLAAASFNEPIRKNVRGLFYDYQDLANGWR
jgi:DNA replication protein DnaC